MFSRKQTVQKGETSSTWANLCSINTNVQTVTAATLTSASNGHRLSFTSDSRHHQRIEAKKRMYERGVLQINGKRKNLSDTSHTWSVSNCVNFLTSITVTVGTKSNSLVLKFDLHTFLAFLSCCLPIIMCDSVSDSHSKQDSLETEPLDLTTITFAVTHNFSFITRKQTTDVRKW